MRAEGTPCAFAVDKDMASGSWTPEEGSSADENHLWNSLIGDAWSTVVGVSMMDDEYVDLVFISIAGMSGAAVWYSMGESRMYEEMEKRLSARCVCLTLVMRITPCRRENMETKERWPGLANS